MADARNGDLKSAESELRKALALSPDDAFCLGTLGAILGMQNKLEESSQFLQKALKVNPEDWTTRRNLASNQFQLGRLAEARENLDIVLKKNPEDKTAVLLLGMVAEEMGDYATAVGRLTSVPELTAWNPKSIAALARSYYRTGAHEQARATLRQMIDSEGVLLGARIAAGADDFQQAESMLASLPPSFQHGNDTRYELALVRYRAGKYAESEKTLRGLLDSGVQNSDVFNLLAWCHYKQDRMKEAVAAMDLAIDRDPAGESNYYDLGLMLLSRDRAPVALEAARKAVEVASGSYRAHLLKGLVEAKLNRLDDAAISYARASELKPDAPEAVVALGVVLSAARRYPEAEKTFRSGLEKFPRCAALYQEYGKSLLEQSDFADAVGQARAVRLLETALSLDPALSEPHFQLGKLALDHDRPREAASHLEIAAKLNPASSRIHFVLSRAYTELQRPDNAAREMELFEQAKAREEGSAPTASRGETPPLPQ
ncbi:MAG TPA: tetratricopeptide repeat protein [Bryobacteraceae bacterium]|nr:tetratricopeptide repeat protein [Bryobacteraceae bacterium]